MHHVVRIVLKAKLLKGEICLCKNDDFALFGFVTTRKENRPWSEIRFRSFDQEFDDDDDVNICNNIYTKK